MKNNTNKVGEGQLQRTVYGFDTGGTTLSLHSYFINSTIQYTNNFNILITLVSSNKSLIKV